MKTIIVDSFTHDKMLSLTSHLPHLLSFAYVNFLKKTKNRNLKNFIGPYFNDLTRVADNNYEIWSDILISNKENIINFGKNFINELSSLLNKLETASKEDLLKILKDIKKYKIKSLK